MICAPESKLVKNLQLLLHPSFNTLATVEGNERENPVMQNECLSTEADKSKWIWLLLDNIPPDS